MSYQKILTVQDISCVGQCSLTVALPILSACGLETCILPSAILSTHTAGFTGFTCRDLTEDFPAILAHWKKESISFDAVYTGYLGSTEQIGLVKEIFSTLTSKSALRIVDPAMADGGKLYPAFNEGYVSAMKGLCAQADILLPNLTEACFLTDTPYSETYDEAYILSLCKKLSALFKGTIVLTGVGIARAKRAWSCTNVKRFATTNTNALKRVATARATSTPRRSSAHSLAVKARSSRQKSPPISC